jgi:hypothetical protein
MLWVGEQEKVADACEIETCFLLENLCSRGVNPGSVGIFAYSSLIIWSFMYVEMD